jgi:NAD(P)H-flavin reductase/hemoglobin-like flavoprotein
VAVGEEEQAERKPRPGTDDHADHADSRRLLPSGLPRREPTADSRNVPQPIPDISAQEVAKITRLLAEERAGLADERGAATGQSAGRPGRLSAVASAGSLPVPHQSVPDSDRAPAVLPWPRPSAEPPWHVIGRTLRRGRPGSGAGSGSAPPPTGPSADHPGAQLSPVGLADPQAAVPTLPTAAEPAEPRSAPVSSEPAMAGPAVAEDARAGAVPSGAGPAGPAVAEDARADAAPLGPKPAEPAVAEDARAGAVPSEPGPAHAAVAGAEPGDVAPPGAVPGPEAPPDPTIAAVRETFAIVAAAGGKAASYFYGWLFARHPELRELFPPAMDAQRDRLLRALARIVESMSTPEDLAAYLTQLGRDHRKYSVRPEMYEGVGDALMATLRAHAGPAFTPAAQEAWAQAYAAVSQLMIKAAEDDGAVAPAFWTAEVVLNEQRRRGISVLTVAPDQLLPYEPGQHVSVQTARWPRVWRPYSIACRPREDGLMTFHVKAVPGGWVSNALVYHAEPGDDLILGPALGTMTLRPAGGRDLLCIAGGTGLSPIKAIIQQAIKESSACPRQIHLFYGARTRAELYDLPDLWHLQDAYSGFQLTPVTSDDPAFDGMQGNVGRVAARHMPHRECAAYVAGPPAMVRETVHVLTRAGLRSDLIHYDDTLLAGGERAG